MADGSCEMARNYPRCTMRDAHDGQHRIHAGGAREDTRVRYVQASYTPHPMFGIDDRLVRARAHAARCHLMEGDQEKLIRRPTRRVHAPEPVLTCLFSA